MQNAIFALLAAITLQACASSGANHGEAAIWSWIDAGHQEVLLRKSPDLVVYRTIGTTSGKMSPTLEGQLQQELAEAEQMLKESDATWSDVSNGRVLMTSAVEIDDAQRIINTEPVLAEIVWSYKVIDKLSVPTAKVGLELIASAPQAGDAVVAVIESEADEGVHFSRSK